MKKYLSVSVFPLLAFTFLVFPSFSSSSVKADSVLCDVFPFLESTESLTGICTGAGDKVAEDSARQIKNLIQLGLSLVFVGIIILSIYIIIKAAVKYIRSEGKDEEIQAAQRAIKSVFLGVGALFVGIIGIIIVLAFFQATGAVDGGDQKTDNDFIDNVLLGGNSGSSSGGGSTPEPAP